MTILRLTLAGVATASLVAFCGPVSAAETGVSPGAARLVLAQYDAPYYRHHHYRHNPTGYHVNRMGYGNYRRGPDGSFGGYPAGSAGAQILQQQQEKKCQYVPESC